MSETLSSMIQALGLEAAAIRTKGAGAQVQLRGGERVGHAEGSWLYRFAVAEDLNLSDDTPVRLAAGEDDVPGTVVSFRDGVLLVALEQDLGPKIVAARLVANDAFLIERLQERLQKVASGEAQLCQPAAERALGRARPKTADAEPDPAVKVHDLNPEQGAVLRRSLGSDTTFVWGPPGTGKTKTLACVVEAHYRAGRSVLLVSNTNIAVDTALERVADRLKGEPDFHQGLVIRQGLVAKEELREKYGSQVILEQIVARLGETLRRERDDLARQAAQIEVDERSTAAALRDIEALAGARRAFDIRKRAKTDAQSTIKAREREVAGYRQRVVKLAYDIERARAMSRIRRFFSGADPARIEREGLSAERRAQAAESAARALAADLPNLTAELAALQEKTQGLASKTAHYPPAAQIRSRLESLGAQLRKTRERIAGIERELAALEEEVLGRCRILATTVYRTYLGKGPARQFDTVVVDEASMLMPPLVYYAAGLGTTSVTIAGDFRQLPPIVMSDEKLAVDWLKRDVFELARIPERLALGERPPHLVALKTQYRMCEPICGLVNKLFYTDHPLSTEYTRGERQRLPLGVKPLQYVDTAPFHPWTAFRVGTFSRYNLFHALLVRNIVVHLAETGYLPSSGANEALGAVAPYSSQAKLIQALLDDRLGKRAGSIATTVHRFQGNEKHTMLIDLTDSLGVRLGRFLRATGLTEDGARLLNVAASRAQDYVVLVGNFQYLRDKAPQASYVRELVDYFRRHGESLDLDALLPLAEQDWIDGLYKMLPAGFDLPENGGGVFTEGTFYPAFAQDLAQAAESIVILSPYATGRGTARWVESLRAALIRGVRVRVVTRPEAEFGGGGTEEVTELVRGLRVLGVTVDLRARMHEKAAILDGRLLWHGSLNILSHRDTSESMLRLASPAACQELARFLSPPVRRRHGEDAPDFPAATNPECPKCGASTVWNHGRHGIWFKCEIPGCGGKVDPRRPGRPSAKGRSAGSATRSKPCPKPSCGGTLQERDGRYGPFLGCSNYPACRHTEN